MFQASLDHLYIDVTWCYCIVVQHLEVHTGSSLYHFLPVTDVELYDTAQVTMSAISQVVQRQSLGPKRPTSIENYIHIDIFKETTQLVSLTCIWMTSFVIGRNDDGMGHDVDTALGSTCRKKAPVGRHNLIGSGSNLPLVPQKSPKSPKRQDRLTKITRFPTVELPIRTTGRLIINWSNISTQKITKMPSKEQQPPRFHVRRSSHLPSTSHLNLAGSWSASGQVKYVSKPRCTQNSHKSAPINMYFNFNHILLYACMLIISLKALECQSKWMPTDCKPFITLPNANGTTWRTRRDKNNMEHIWADWNNLGKQLNQPCFF